MSQRTKEQKTIEPSILLSNIETLGRRFQEEHLGKWRRGNLESDWFSALHFLLERNFMRGRRDELSAAFLWFTIDRLRHLLRPTDGLEVAYRKLTEHHQAGHLDSSIIADFKKRHRLRGTANSISHKDFDIEIAAINPVAKLLTTKQEVTVEWPKAHRRETRLSNDKDLRMVMDTLSLICEPDAQNVYSFLMRQINENGAQTAYNTLSTIHAVGDKLASMTIRDLGMMNPGLIRMEFGNVFPVDTWVRRVALLLDCDAESAGEIKSFFQQKCDEAGIDIMLFAAGMWYVGANSLRVVFEDFIGQFRIPPRE